MIYYEHMSHSRSEEKETIFQDMEGRRPHLIRKAQLIEARHIGTTLDSLFTEMNRLPEEECMVALQELRDVEIMLQEEEQLEGPYQLALLRISAFLAGFDVANERMARKKQR